MLKGLYSIHDVIAEEYGPVFEAANDLVALRARNHLLADIPESSRDSFRVVNVGTFDNEKGILEGFTFDGIREIAHEQNI